jgi:Protein of unknown function (DUF2975)
MQNVKTVSKILFYITRFLAIFYFTISAHSTIALLTKWSLITKDNGKYFQICYPFTQKPFLLGDNNLGYMIFNFLLPLSLYGLFFLLVSNVFKVFFQPKLFTTNGVKHLKRFYLANLILPSLAVLLASIFTNKVEDPAEFLIMIHFILGVFAYFLAAIFKQGLSLQNEQDLYI